MDRPGDRHFIAGDGLRALAALSVLVFHAWVAMAQRTGEAYGPFGDVALQLNTGLYVFFVLSGYLVAGPYVRAWLEGTAFPDARRYASRRLRRIVPAFWLVVAGLLVWFGTLGASAGEVLALFAFAQNYEPGAVQRLIPQGWTLGIELSFYLALPVLAFLFARAVPQRARAATLWAFLVAVAVGGLWLRSRHSADNAPSANLATLGWAFVPGIALAGLEVQARARLARRAVALALAAVTVVACAALVVAAPDPASTTANVLRFVVGGGLIGAALTWQWATGSAPRVLRARPAQALGRWSYGIYLVHVGVGLELLRHLPAGAGPWPALALLLAGMVVVSVALAAVLWWLVEEPALRKAAPRRPVWLPHAAVPRPDAAEADARGIFIAGDALRALSCLVVVVFHTALGVAALYGLSPNEAFGAAGDVIFRTTPVVFVFFTLSGYLVGGPFVRAWLRDDRWPASRRYLERRARRIVPAFWVVCALSALYFGTNGAEVQYVVALFAFLQNIESTGLNQWMPQGWTLSVEAMFYVGLPLLALVLARVVPRSEAMRWNVLVAGLLVLTVAGLVWRTLVPEVDGLGGRNAGALMHAFGPGMLLAAVEHRYKARLRGTQAARRLGQALIASFVLGWAIIVASGRNDGFLAVELASILVGTGSVAGLLLLQWATGRAPRWIDNDVMHAIGRWSYGIYLVHVFVLLVLIERVPSTLGANSALLVTSAAVIGLSTVAAAALWWLVEEPFLRKRRPRPFWREVQAVQEPPRPTTVEPAPPAAAAVP